MADDSTEKQLPRVPVRDAREVGRMIPIPGDINSGRIPTNMVPVPEGKPGTPPSSPPEEKK